MSNILRLALCGQQDLTEQPTQTPDVEENAEGKSITMTGPLSEVYTKALQIVYAKTDSEKGIMAIESQANDALMLIAIRKANNAKNSNLIDQAKFARGISGVRNTVVNVIDSNTANSTNVLCAANSLINDTPTNTDTRTILVIDGGDEATGEFNTLIEEQVDTTNSQVSLKQATENICQKLGIELYYSFEEFVARL